MAQIIYARCGTPILVDDADYEALSLFSWFINGTGYAARRRLKSDGPGAQQIMMHRQILQTPKGVFTDHADRNRVNNQRYNIRACTPGENARNTTPREGCSSRFKGVGWQKNKRKWQAYIKFERKMKHLGFYDCEIKAALAYNQAAIELHRNFVSLNDVGENV